MLERKFLTFSSLLGDIYDEFDQKVDITDVRSVLLLYDLHSYDTQLTITVITVSLVNVPSENCLCGFFLQSTL